MKCSATDRDRICTLFESERPDDPWTLDAGGYYLNEIRARVYPEAWPGAASGATYNPAIGYLIGVANPNPDLSQGWLGIQNGTIQNLALDALATTHGGKLIALNVTARGIRNGMSDRSQHGMASPAHQAHNSCIQVTGTAVDAQRTGAVAYWINAGGSWNYQGSHAGSGGCVNVNQRGVLRIISRGEISSDVFPGDGGCMGRPCQSSLIVNPTADLSVVGPLVFSMGPRADANRFSGSGVGRASRFFRVVFHRKGSFDSLIPVLPAFFSFPPQIAPQTSALELNEVVFKSAGKGALFNLCEVGRGASRRISGRNVIVEPVGSETYQAVIADCGGTGCSGGDCGGVIEAIENSNVSMQGILDHPGSAGLNRYFVQPAIRLLGSCGLPGTFRGDLCSALGAAGLPLSQWSWFESRGASAAPCD
jgi:uncharacterized membrane protein